MNIMQFVVKLVSLTITVFFSLGIAMVASITTYRLVYKAKSNNKKEAIIDALKDGLVFLFAA